MRRMLGILLCLFSAASLHAQPPAMRDQPEAQRELGKAMEPLKTLNDRQMAAVAGLVLASRAGFSVEEYCPPLKKFTAPDKRPCLGDMASYASEARKCKKSDPTWKECPKVREAEAAWTACEVAFLMENLRELKLTDFRPTPGPQPKPVAR